MKRICFLIVVCWAAQSAAQNMPELIAGGNSNKLVSEAISPMFFVVDQCYRIKDKEDRVYTAADNEDCFNRIKSLGIKVQTGIYVTDKAYEPWVTDELFMPYAKQKYTGVRYHTDVEDSRDSNVLRTLDEESVYEPIVGERLFHVTTNVWKNEGFPLDTATGRVSGYLVWVMTPDTNEYGSFSLKASSHQLDIAPIKDTLFPVSMGFANAFSAHSKGMRVVGGVFVTSHVIAPGQVEFCLRGVAVDTSGNGTWVLATNLQGLQQKTKIVDEKESTHEVTGPTIELREAKPMPKKDVAKPGKPQKTNKKKS